MPINRVNSEITPAQAEAIRAALAAAADTNPPPASHPPSSPPRWKPRGKISGFCSATAMAFATKERFFSPNFNMPWRSSGVRSTRNGRFSARAVQDLLGKLEDTYFAAGSEAYAGALLVYQYAKAANVATGALEDALDDLGRRFARRSKAAGSAGNGGG